MKRDISETCDSMNGPSLEENTSSKAARLEGNTVGLPTIRLTAEEERLFEFLLKVIEEKKCGTMLRVAGGWVRDKILGRESDDIDIVLDNLTGKQFADLINDYEAQHGQKTHSVGVIKANPDQSKHLETATMQLGDGWVDFVNLRAETYSEHSRIPEMEFGTPLQDAERRDFTVNALFYNIGERKVEDFTGRGLEDLHSGIIRTPLEPRVTFLDDPIRVLRAIRFVSRFNFKLADDLLNSINLPEVKEALYGKVSRERVGKELHGMITGNRAHPERAFGFLHRLGLSKCVFHPPENVSIFQSDGTPHQLDFEEKAWDTSYQFCARMHELLHDEFAMSVLEISGLDRAEITHLTMLAAVLLPTEGHYYMQKKRRVPVAFHIIRESLKFKSKDAQVISEILLPSLQSLQHFAMDSATLTRVSVGSCLRSFKQHWPLCWALAAAHSVVLAKSDESESRRLQFRELANWIREENLTEVWKLKPLLNGKELMKELSMKPGPEIPRMQQRVLEWQLENPEGSREECLSFLRG